MIEVQDFGQAYKDMLPDMLNRYPGYEVDHYVLTHSDMLYAVDEQLKTVLPEAADTSDRQRLKDIVRKRHATLQYKQPYDDYSDLPEPDELMLKTWEIQDVWESLYLQPRVGPVSESLYGEWLAHCLHVGQDIRLQQRATYSAYGQMALLDLEVPPVHGKFYKILVPPTVSVEAPNGLGATQLMTWSNERPLVDDNGNSSPILCLTTTIAQRLLFELGVTDERIEAIALSGPS